MRDPSMHIRKSDFKKLLKSCGIKLTSSQVDYLYKESIHFRINNRYILQSNKKTIIDKILRIHKTESVPVEIFHQSLVSVRQLLGHKYVPKIGKDSAQYNLLKEVCVLAVEFCEVFNRGTNEGFVEFCKIGIKLMGKKYALNKFKYYKERIFKFKEWEILINEDQGSNLTQELLEYYSLTLASKGIDFKIDRMEEAVDFIYAKNDMVENNATVKNWIDSQFSQMEYMDIFPNPNQLYGENAAKRYKEFMMAKPKIKEDVSVDYDPSKFLNKLKK